MRYNKELQAAGKFFVATVQGEDGRQGRELIKKLQADQDLALDLRVYWRDGKFVATVGTYRWLDEEWPTQVLIAATEIE